MLTRPLWVLQTALAIDGAWQHSANLLSASPRVVVKEDPCDDVDTVIYWIPSLQAGYFLSEHFLLYTKGFSDVMILSRNRGHNGARLRTVELMEQKTLKVSWSYLCTFPTNLQEKFKLFFELGLSLAVSGDTPTIPLVTLVLFVGPLGCSSANLKTSLNASRSTAAFSIDVCSSCTHMGNIPVKPNTAFIQKIHLLRTSTKQMECASFVCCCCTKSADSEHGGSHLTAGTPCKLRHSN